MKNKIEILITGLVICFCFVSLVNAELICGDGTCVGRADGTGENCESCPQDCSCPSGFVCDPSDPNADLKGCVGSVCEGCIETFYIEDDTLPANGTITKICFKFICPGDVWFDILFEGEVCSDVQKCGGFIRIPGSEFDEDVVNYAYYKAPMLEPTEELSGTMTLFLRLTHVQSGDCKLIPVTIDIGEYVPPSEATITISTDKDTYEQGEAVTITGQVLSKDGQPIPVKQKLVLTVDVPDSTRPEEGRRLRFFTDDSGQFSIMPFAGWNTGEYKLHVQGKIESEGKVEGETTFKVVKAEPGLMCGYKFNKIVELYKSQVPEGPVRRDPDLHTGLPESWYGKENNIYCDMQLTVEFACVIVPERLDFCSFVCGGCQGHALDFFDGLRFNKDPDKRNLLKGLDYGPIARGAYIFGGHHAVVLYPIGTEWYRLGYVRPEEESVVFDSWPTQKPETYDVVEFSGGWGFVRADESRWAQPTDIWSGWPLVGSEVCSNPKLKSTKPKIPAVPSSGVYVDCPVDVLITNSEGKRTGMLPDGNLVQEFPAWAYRASEDNKDLGWYFGLPEGVYSVVTTGKSTGTFRLRVIGDLAGGQALDYGSQSITEGAQARITLDSANPAAPLILPDGTDVVPEIFSIALEDTEGLIQFNFNDGQAQNWIDDGSRCWSISDGVYVMTGNKKGDVNRFSHYNPEFCDFTFAADVRKIAGDSNDRLSAYGLWIRSDGTENNHYMFAIVVDGRYMIAKSVGGVFTEMIDMTTSDALKTGYNEWNTLKVVAQDSILQFYANGVLLETKKDTVLSCGKVGLFAVDSADSDSSDTVQFDNVLIVKTAE